MTRYVALLRGINVGGNNPIKMSALKACFEKHGFHGVTTYIASGNVLFDADGAKAAALGATIEAALSKTFDYRASVVLRSAKQMRDTLTRAPKGFGTQRDKYRYDVLFLKEPLTPAAALRSVVATPGVDEVHTGPGALYFSRLVARVTESQLPKLLGTAAYKSMTIRNYNTTAKLVALLDTSAVL
ncbi:MAG TPA: DUF1697 domain-containing protein [Polyangiaceae bacterium]